MQLGNTILWIVKIVIAGILLQTLYFKFSAHPDSIYIFEQTGLGTAGRIGTGIVELIVALMILYQKTSWLGALGATGLMAGAIFFHLTSLGVEVNNDGGLLFKLSLIVIIGSLYILWKHRKEIPFLKIK